MIQVIFVFFALLFSNSLWADSRQLHISTWPSSAEISLGKPHDPYESPIRTPAILPLVESDSIIDLYIFKSGYIAKHLQIRTKKSSDNYVQFFLSQELDSSSLEQHQDYEWKRFRISLGKKLLWTSIIPAFGAISLAGIAEYYFQESKQIQQKLNQAAIQSDPQYFIDVENAKAANQNGVAYRSAAIYSLVTALAMSSIGIVLEF